MSSKMGGNWKWMKWLLASFLALFLISRFLLPTPGFTDPTSTLIEAKDGTLLSARIAPDGQWRFPEMDSVPERFEQCLLHFEDRNFYLHPGIDPKGIVRAMRENIRAGRVVQGGSTLTMQVARMLGHGEERSLWNKFKEALLTLHLEINLSKKEILETYASHAPFGGNVVGLEAAAWRYYGRNPWELSWAESATLAVLPNAPSLIYPGKGQALLLAKRNRLLSSMEEAGIISSEDYELALIESLPQRPEPMPAYATHLMDKYAKRQSGERIRTQVDARLQQEAQRLLNSHVQALQSIEVNNGALIVLDTRTQEEIIYVGNANYTRDHANAVDCASAPRNSGSILKPIIYAEMLQAGELTPHLLLQDIPSQFAEYMPENYHGDYDGAVPADEALFRSLNIPFVRLLKQYGVARFQKDLKALGLSTLTRSPEAYGLTLMLGGAEVRLDELAGLYARMGNALEEKNESYPLKPWAIHHTFEAICELTRPEGREYQRSFNSSRKIAWKTGTSYGNKDAWAIGVTPDHTIAVWMGNADGEGRNGLTGVSSAAPLLFDMLDLLPAGDWFYSPSESGTMVDLCRQSGYLIGAECPDGVTLELPAADYSEVGNCPFHRLIFTTPDEKWQGKQGCAGDEVLEAKNWFILPPIQEYFYKVKHMDYRPVPLMLKGCELNGSSMEFIYPQRAQQVYIPVDLDGSASRVICKLAHRDSEAEVHWYLDTSFLGTTARIHEMPILCGQGNHTLLAVDQSGEEIALNFMVVSD